MPGPVASLRGLEIAITRIELCWNHVLIHSWAILV